MSTVTPDIDRPTFRCIIRNGDDEHIATIIALSTADALATYLDRLPERGRQMFAMNVRSLRRKHDDAMRRWDRHGSRALSSLVAPRYIGNPDDAYLFTCGEAVEMPADLEAP